MSAAETNPLGNLRRRPLSSLPPSPWETFAGFLPETPDCAACSARISRGAQPGIPQASPGTLARTGQRTSLARPYLSLRETDPTAELRSQGRLYLWERPRRSASCARTGLAAASRHRHPSSRPAAPPQTPGRPARSPRGIARRQPTQRPVAPTHHYHHAHRQPRPPTLPNRACVPAVATTKRRRQQETPHQTPHTKRPTLNTK